MRPYDHVIIGGGVVGASVAYHLACMEVGSVLLLERNELASAASSRAAGLLLQVTAKPTKTPLALLTRQIINTLEDELSDTVGFHGVGSLRVAVSDDCQSELDTVADDAARHGIAIQWLDTEDARSLVPWLDSSRANRIAFFPTDGYVDPYLLATAYARAARGRGVEFRLRTAVEDIVVEKGQVTGVKTSGGEIACGNVIDAGGAWASLLSAQVGFLLPMAPVRSHYWITAPDDALGGDHPVVLLPDAAAYTRPDVDSLLLGIQEPHSATFDARDLPNDPAAFSPTTGDEHWDILADAADRVGQFYPGVADIEVASYVCGLSCYTPDGQIVLGPVPGVSGFLAAAGCCGSGVMLSAGMGAAIADLALGRAPQFDISPFRPDRFGRVDPYSIDFRASCAGARARKSR